jgi:hypothetical protein
MYAFSRKVGTAAHRIELGLHKKRSCRPITSTTSFFVLHQPTNTWLAVADELRTASVDFDERKLQMIKEVLHSF